MTTLPQILDNQSVFCPHPDALKRRQEAEQQRRQRERERAEAEAQEASGLKWWEGTLPANMINVLSAYQLDYLTHQANAEGKLVLMNFFTEDCFTCRTLHPKLKKIALDNPDVLFLKLNGSSEALRELFVQNRVTKVPLFQCVRNGWVRSSFSASLAPEKLAYLRAEIAANKSPCFDDEVDNDAYSELEG